MILTGNAPTLIEIRHCVIQHRVHIVTPEEDIQMLFSLALEFRFQRRGLEIFTHCAWGASGLELRCRKRG